jgi:hypothetical protein
MGPYAKAPFEVAIFRQNQYNYCCFNTLQEINLRPRKCLPRELQRRSNPPPLSDSG